MVLEELQRRNYADITIKNYLRIIDVIIRMFTVSFRREDSLSMSPPGFVHGKASSSL
jgi:hypothetical protein